MYLFPEDMNVSGQSDRFKRLGLAPHTTDAIREPLALRIVAEFRMFFGLSKVSEDWYQILQEWRLPQTMTHENTSLSFSN